MSILVVQSVSKSYGTLPALQQVSFNLEAGFYALLGQMVRAKRPYSNYSLAYSPPIKARLCSMA